VRGADGLGLHILDILPESFEGVEGIEEAVAARKKRVEFLATQPPLFLPFEKRIKEEPGRAQKCVSVCPSVVLRPCVCLSVYLCVILSFFVHPRAYRSVGPCLLIGLAASICLVGQSMSVRACVHLSAAPMLFSCIADVSDRWRRPQASRHAHIESLARESTKHPGPRIDFSLALGSAAQSGLPPIQATRPTKPRPRRRNRRAPYRAAQQPVGKGRLPNRVRISYCSCQIGRAISYAFQWCSRRRCSGATWPGRTGCQIGSKYRIVHVK
jgi:hypothetical protein